MNPDVITKLSIKQLIQNVMFTTFYNPHPALLEYVETICVINHEFTQGDVLSPIYTYVPTHTRFLCFYLADPVVVKKGVGDYENHGRSVIIGPQLTPVTLDLGKNHANLLVILKPGALYRLLGIPLIELVDCYFDARLVVGKEIDQVTEQLMNASSSLEKNNIIQKYLLQKLASLKPALPIDLAMLQLVLSQGKISMDCLAKLSCLSVRQLERQSLQRIGLPPKYFSRMIRFSEAYKFKERNPQSCWIDIVYRFGYYDQMHLIRDFHHFTGNNPSKMKEDFIIHSVKFNSVFE
ncbi:MAG: helix-turn-helix domain-containing protein [Flavobacterium sp.]